MRRSFPSFRQQFKKNIQINYLMTNERLSPPISLIHFSTVQIQIEEITRKLKTGDLGVSAVPEERFGITNT